MGKVYKRGSKWYITYQYHGRQVRRSISRSKRMAELALKDIELKMERGQFLGVFDGRKVRFDEFMGEFLAWSKAHKSPRSYDRDEGIVRVHLLPYFRDRYLTAITRELIEKYVSLRVSQVKPATVNRELACIKKIFTLAVDWDYLQASPAQGVKTLRFQEPEPRYLSKEEIGRLLGVCADHLYPIVVTALHTGMRRGELFNLRWEHVDLAKRLITVVGPQHTKTYESRLIPVNEELYDLLSQVSENPNQPYVFPSWRTGRGFVSLQKSFRQAVQAAGLGRVRFHDLRHTFASHLVMAGVDLRTVQSLLGHKNINMTLRYSHLSPGHLKAAVDKLSYSTVSTQ